MHSKPLTKGLWPRGSTWLHEHVGLARQEVCSQLSWSYNREEDHKESRGPYTLIWQGPPTHEAPESLQRMLTECAGVGQGPMDDKIPSTTRETR